MTSPKAAQIATRNGGRRVELFVPFTFGEEHVRSIDLGPFRLDHLERWREGEFKSALELLADLAGWDMPKLRQLAYPDVDRVLGAFVEMCPPAVQADIAQGFTRTGILPADLLAPEQPAAEAEQAGEPEPEPEPIGMERPPTGPVLVPEALPPTPTPAEIPPHLRQWPFPGGAPPEPPAEEEELPNLDLTGEGR